MPRKRRTARKNNRKSRNDPLARERMFESIQLMRSKDYSLTRAAREAHTTPETVRKYGRSALTRSKNGRYAATSSDRMTRRVWMLTTNGKEEASFRGSKAASLVAQYMIAVDRFSTTGDTRPLAAFEGQVIRSGKKTFPFITDTEVLERLANAGEISFERLYVRRA